MFLLGTAETFADNASSTLVPMLVQRDDLALANSRIMAGFVTVNQLVGPPLGAFLFAVGQALAVRRARPCWSPRARCWSPRWSCRRTAPSGTTTHIRHDIAEGVRWVRHHAAVRTLVLTILIFNVTFGAAWSVLVLYAREHLGLGRDRVRPHHDRRRGRRPRRHR